VNFKGSYITQYTGKCNKNGSVPNRKLRDREKLKVCLEMCKSKAKSRIFIGRVKFVSYKS